MGFFLVLPCERDLVLCIFSVKKKRKKAAHCFPYGTMDFDMWLISAPLFQEDWLHCHDAMSLIVNQLLLSELQLWRDSRVATPGRWGDTSCHNYLLETYTCKCSAIKVSEMLCYYFGHVMFSSEAKKVDYFCFSSTFPIIPRALGSRTEWLIFWEVSASF